MIRIILIIALLLFALALGPLLLDEKGYILISMGNQIVELSVYAAFFWLVCIALTGILAYKVIRGGAKLSFSVWNTMAFAGKRRGIAQFNMGLAAYVLKDYNQAEKLFAKSAIPSKRTQSAYLMAASASAKLQCSDKTNHYLDLLDNETSNSKNLDLTAVIVKIRLLMDQKNVPAYEKARALLNQHHKQINRDARLLSLEIDLCLTEQRFEQAVTNLVAARKEKTIADDVLNAWESKAYFGVFNDIICQKDLASLQAYWQKLSRKHKQREAILFAYCKVLAAQNITEPLNTLLTPALKKSPSTHFLKQLRSLPIKQADELISLVQKHLHKGVHNANWLSCLGHLACSSEQWSMAEKAFRSLIHLEAKQYDKQDLQAFAMSLTKQEQHQAANEVWLTINELTETATVNSAHLHDA